MKEHEGPRIDKIPVTGTAGLIFAIGVMLIIFIGVPQARLWLYISVPLGIAVGVVLRYMHRGQM